MFVMKDKAFRENSFTPPKVCSTTTTMISTETDGAAYIESIKDRLFYQALGRELGDYIIKIIALSIGGVASRLRHMFFLLGPPRSGKGVITVALCNAFKNVSGTVGRDSNISFPVLSFACLVGTSTTELSIFGWTDFLREEVTDDVEGFRTCSKSHCWHWCKLYNPTLCSKLNLIERLQETRKTAPPPLPHALDC